MYMQLNGRSFPIAVGLWTVGNYHWYQKQKLEFSRTDRIGTLQWDTEHAYRLHVVCHSGQYLQYTWAWTTDVNRGPPEGNLATVAVIDGGGLYLVCRQYLCRDLWILSSRRMPLIAQGSIDRAARSIDFAYGTNHFTIVNPHWRKHTLYMDRLEIFTDLKY